MLPGGLVDLVFPFGIVALFKSFTTEFYQCPLIQCQELKNVLQMKIRLHLGQISDSSVTIAALRLWLKEEISEEELQAKDACGVMGIQPVCCFL